MISFYHAGALRQAASVSLSETGTIEQDGVINMQQLSKTKEG